MKLQITVNDAIVPQIDALAKALGVSRSALCAIWIGQGLLGYKKAQQLVENLKPEDFRLEGEGQISFDFGETQK